jgi:hypothetical protein
VMGVMVINPLTSGAVTTNALTYRLYGAVAEDVNFEGYQPQRNFITPFGEPVDIDKCDDTNGVTTFDQRYKRKCPLLGVTGAVSLNVGITSSNLLTTIKQLTNTSTAVYTELAGSVVPTGSFVQYSFINTNFYIPDNIGGLSRINPLTNLRQIFAFFRGGMRVSITSNSDLSCETHSNYEKTAATGLVIADSITSTIYTVANCIPFSAAGSHYFASSNLQPIDFVIPFLGKNRCMPIYHKGATTSTPLYTTRVVARFEPNGDSTSSTVSTTKFYVGGADDFTFGYLLPVPPVTTTLPY